ncbi:MAG: pantoate--beta-alanine ligase [Bacteroidales bacterium]|nr:pantoate--beta-alanine ligase [Bacteroidales bacterium]
MLIVNTVKALKEAVLQLKNAGKTIGLVPTMGALHDGHLSLIRRAGEENDAVVVSIFVNPVQFNNQADLIAYPRTLEADVEKIGDLADVVFAPSAEEVYAVPPTEKYDFGALEQVMEGPQRPGHFNGVGIIVKRLFDWTTPDRAYFGEKDYQQLLIIRSLVKQCGLSVQIVPCPIVREANGLAMSSRNKRLSPAQFEVAANIHRIMLASTQLPDNTVAKAKAYVEKEIAKISEFELEYYAIADKDSLQSTDTLNNAIGCIAVWCGDVRLIDNIMY